MTKYFVETLETVKPLDERDKIEVADRMKDSHRRAFGPLVVPSENSTELSVSSASNPQCKNGVSVNSASQLQVCNTIDPSTGLQLATPLCALSVRGSETSIPLESGKIKARVGDKAGAVGKEVKKLYGMRYGQDAANKIPKRSRIFRGKPFHENTYFNRDSDLIQRVIRKDCDR